MRILGRVLEGISSVTHIIMGMLFSWAFGRLGWHVSWSILFMIVVYKWNERYMRAYAARRHEEFLREQAHKSVIAGDKETVIWYELNIFYCHDIRNTIFYFYFSSSIFF